MSRFRRRCVALVALVVAACSTPPDEVTIRGLIDSMQAAVEGKQASAFLEHVAAEYTDGYGQSRHDLKRMLLHQFLRNENIGVYLTGVEIRVEGIRAEANLTAGLTGGAGSLPERARLYRLSTRWRKTGDDWRVDYAEWRPLTAPAS